MDLRMIFHFEEEAVMTGNELHEDLARMQGR